MHAFLLCCCEISTLYHTPSAHLVPPHFLTAPAPLPPTQDHPLHLYDALTGALRASYRGYNDADEPTAATSCAFTPDGAGLYAGYARALRRFDLSRPGRDCMRLDTWKKRREGALAGEGVRGGGCGVGMDTTCCGALSAGHAAVPPSDRVLPHCPSPNAPALPFTSLHSLSACVPNTT
jgi:hypothetical protein